MDIAAQKGVGAVSESTPKRYWLGMAGIFIAFLAISFDSVNAPGRPSPSNIILDGDQSPAKRDYFLHELNVSSLWKISNHLFYRTAEPAAMIGRSAKMTLVSYWFSTAWQLSPESEALLESKWRVELEKYSSASLAVSIPNLPTSPKFSPKPLLPQREPLGSAKAGLRRGQGEFTTAYGKPAKEGVGITTPADKTMLFDTKWDLAYAVSFWNDVAHHIDIWRWDKKKLTEQDIEKALESFAGGEQWKRSYRNILFGEIRWEREGAAAWLIEQRGKQGYSTDEDTPVNSVRITTTEFWEAHKKAEGF